ncbi:MAG: hypothetical protein ACK52U_12290 [Synechococcaceae cyanobacterium]
MAALFLPPSSVHAPVLRGVCGHPSSFRRHPVGLAAPCQGARSWAHQQVTSAPGIPLALAAMLLLAAVLVAPEQPLAQEAICQRHNGVAACRVW